MPILCARDSASVKEFVESKIEDFLLCRSYVSKRQTERLAIGSRPIVGSSKNATKGAPIRVTATLRSLRLPADTYSTALSASPIRLNSFR